MRQPYSLLASPDWAALGFRAGFLASGLSPARTPPVAPRGFLLRAAIGLRRRSAGTVLIAVESRLADRLLGGAEIDTGPALGALDAVDRGARDQIAIKGDGPAGVVIAGNRMADAVGIGI